MLFVEHSFFGAVYMTSGLYHYFCLLVQTEPVSFCSDNVVLTLSKGSSVLYSIS